MNKELPATKTLGKVSAEFVTALQNIGKSIFSLDDAQEISRRTRAAVTDLIRDLVKRGILARIKAGTYIILQSGNENTQLRNWPVIARELAGKDPYFISYYSAMRIHGMTSHPIHDVYLTTPKRKAKRTLSNVTYHFIYCKNEHYWGHTQHWATKQEQVQTSDLERTILDGFDRPEFSGGITDVIRGLWAVQKKVKTDQLVAYAKKFRTSAAVKRLGFVLEALELFENIIPSLNSAISAAKGYSLLDPLAQQQGRRRRRWGVRENINIEEIKASVWG